MADKDLNIILVDDNEIDIVVNSKLLKLSNITENIHSFGNCGDALTFFKKNADSIKKMRNIILMDIQMPELDGFECVGKIIELSDDILKSITIYMLSSSIDRNDIKRAEEHPNIDKILEKPLDVYQLKRLLEEV